MPDGLDEVRRDWEQLGAEDPLWAVLMMPGTRHGGWDIEDFLRTGRFEVDTALTHLRSLARLRRIQHALDFGSGAGRTTQALAEHADTVVGVDIAESMVEVARRLDRTDGRCRFLYNPRRDLTMFESETFDLVYSSLVLQHLPPSLARTYLTELARVVRPGGALIVQVATAPTRSLKGLLFRYAPHRLLRFGQQRLLRYPAPMRMHGVAATTVRDAVGQHHVEVLDRVEDTSYGGHWTYHRYFAAKRRSR